LHAASHEAHDTAPPVANSAEARISKTPAADRIRISGATFFKCVFVVILS
jgi:hypothetical protein